MGVPRERVDQRRPMIVTGCRAIPLPFAVVVDPARIDVRGSKGRTLHDVLQHDTPGRSPACFLKEELCELAFPLAPTAGSKAGAGVGADPLVGCRGGVLTLAR